MTKGWLEEKQDKLVALLDKESLETIVRLVSKLSDEKLKALYEAARQEANSRRMFHSERHGFWSFLYER